MPITKILALLSFIMFASVLYHVGLLSKRLGEVMGMKKYYYIYYIGIFFILLGVIFMILPSGQSDNGLYVYGTFALGLTCGLVASIKYWSWIFKELIKP